MVASGVPAGRRLGAPCGGGVDEAAGAIFGAWRGARTRRRSTGPVEAGCAHATEVRVVDATTGRELPWAYGSSGWGDDDVELAVGGTTVCWDGRRRLEVTDMPGDALQYEAATVRAPAGGTRVLEVRLHRQRAPYLSQVVEAGGRPAGPLMLHGGGWDDDLEGRPQAEAVGAVAAVRVLGVRLPADSALLGYRVTHSLLDHAGGIGIVGFELEEGVFPYGDFVVME